MKSSLQKEIDEWLGNDDPIAKPTSPFFDMVDGMIAYNKRRRIDLPAHLVRSMHVVAYAMEYCTVKWDGGKYKAEMPDGTIKTLTDEVYSSCGDKLTLRDGTEAKRIRS